MRYSQALWRPLDHSFDVGGIWALGLVLHVMEGELQGTDQWFRRPRTKEDPGSSAHFGLARNGLLYQWVDTGNRAWAQAAGNDSYVSVEIEGFVGDGLSINQFKALVSLVQWMHDHHGMPFALANHPNERGLGYHAMGGVAWGNHPCPGAPIIAMRQAILDAAKGGVQPMFNPAITNIVAAREWVDGGAFLLGGDGSLYALFGAPVIPGANGHDYFVNRTAADFVHGADNKVTRNSLGGVSILATSGERYDLAPK